MYLTTARRRKLLTPTLNPPQGKRVAERPALEKILSDKVVKVQSRLLKAQAETREAVGEKKQLLQKIADLRHYWLQDVANRQEVCFANACCI